MQEYKQAVDQVMAYLSEQHYCQTIIQANKRCFQLLEEYLNMKGDDYTPERADIWFSTHTEEIGATSRDIYKIALLRLEDVYRCGEILLVHDTRHFRSYSLLSESLRNSLEDFLQSLNNSRAARTVNNYRHSCARFLIFVQRAGAAGIEEITFSMLADFYRSDIHFGKNGKHQMNSAVTAMMSYFFQKQLIPYGYTIITHYLSHGKNSGCYWNSVSPEGHEMIVGIMDDKPTVTTDILRSYKEKSEQVHHENGYSRSMISAYRRAVDLLILFLEMNDYRYHPEIAMIWFSDISSCFGKEADTIRRSLCMIADCHYSSEIRLETIYRRKPSAFSLLPEWCREAANGYVDSKIKEGWARSTLDMIRSCICRFCRYLDLSGIHSFKEVDVSHIKQFNIQDKHKTPQGKNAYNVRIRKFLLYLGEHGYLKNPMLFAALNRTSAPKETIVVVLTESEMAELKEQLERDDSRLTLRKKAMLLLGLKMGLRSSDIVKLEIDDVNWNTSAIRFIQKKTSVEVFLPMPTEVGNALFRYITEERHPKKTRTIFLSEKAPHKPVGGAVCRDALDTALPERNVEGSGFHVTRKTYATGLLRSGVGAGIVAEALGQRGTSSVDRYLSLDVERMRKCPLSLTDFGMGGWYDGR